MQILKKLTFLNILFFVFLLKDSVAVVTIDQVYDVNFHKISRITNSYLKRVLIKEKPLGSFLYGNDTCGYFRSKNFEKVNDKYELRIIPPCYMEGIAILIKRNINEDAYELVTKINFKNPAVYLNNYFQTQIIGNQKIPFILLKAGMVDYKRGEISNTEINLIINKFGEVVWSYYNELGKKDLFQYPLKPSLKIKLNYEELAQASVKGIDSQKYSSLYSYEDLLLGVLPKKTEGELYNSYLTLDKKSLKEVGRLVIINNSVQYSAVKAIPLKIFGGVESLGMNVK